MKKAKNSYALSYNEKIALEYWIKNGEYNKKEVASKLIGDILDKEKAASYCKGRLRRSGVVRGEFPDVDVKSLGYTFFATIMIKLVDMKEMNIFNDTMKVLPEVRECYIVKGTYDFILETLTPTEKEFRDFVNYLRNTDMIEKIMIFEKQDCVFSKPHLPIFT